MASSQFLHPPALTIPTQSELVTGLSNHQLSFKWSASSGLLPSLPGEYSCALLPTSRSAIQALIGPIANRLAQSIRLPVHPDNIPHGLLLIEILWNGYCCPIPLSSPERTPDDITPGSCFTPAPPPAYKQSPTMVEVASVIASGAPSEAATTLLRRYLQSDGDNDIPLFCSITALALIVYTQETHTESLGILRALYCKGSQLAPTNSASASILLFAAYGLTLILDPVDNSIAFLLSVRRFVSLLLMRNDDAAPALFTRLCIVRWENGDCSLSREPFTSCLSTLGCEIQLAFACLARVVPHFTTPSPVYPQTLESEARRTSVMATFEDWVPDLTVPPTFTFWENRFRHLINALDPQNIATSVDALSVWAACCDAYVALHDSHPPSFLYALLSFHTRSICQRFSLEETGQNLPNTPWTYYCWQDAFCDALNRSSILSGPPIILSGPSGAGMAVSMLAHVFAAIGTRPSHKLSKSVEPLRESQSQESRLTPRLRARVRNTLTAFSLEPVQLRDQVLGISRKMRIHLQTLTRHCAATIIANLKLRRSLPREPFERPKGLPGNASNHAHSICRQFVETLRSVAGLPHAASSRKAFLNRRRRPTSFELLLLLAIIRIAVEAGFSAAPLATLTRVVLEWQTEGVKHDEIRELREILMLCFASLRHTGGPPTMSYLQSEALGLLEVKRSLETSADALYHFQRVIELWAENCPQIFSANPVLHTLAQGHTLTSRLELSIPLSSSDAIFVAIAASRRAAALERTALGMALIDNLSQVATAAAADFSPTAVNESTDANCAGWIRRTFSDISNMHLTKQIPSQTLSKDGDVASINEFMVIWEEAADSLYNPSVTDFPSTSVTRPLIFSPIINAETSEQRLEIAGMRTRSLAALGACIETRLMRWMYDSHHDVFCPCVVDLADPLTRQLYTHPIGLASLCWFLNQIEVALIPFLARVCEVTEPSLPVPISFEPLIANGLVESGLMLPFQLTKMLNSQSSNVLGLFKCLEHTLVTLFDHLGNGDPCSLLGEAIVQTLARIVSMITSPNSKKRIAFAIPTETRLLNTLFPLDLTTQWLPDDMARISHQPILTFESYHSRFEISSRIRKAIGHAKMHSFGSISRPIRRLKRAALDERSSGLKSALDRDMLSRDHVLANCLRLSLCASLVAQHLIADRQNTLENDESPSIVDRKWNDALEYHSWTNQAMVQVASMASALALPDIGSTHSREGRRQRKALIVSTLAQLLESTRDLYLLHSTELAKPSRRLKRGVRGMWRKVGSGIFKSQQDRWLKWINRRAPDGGLHGLSESLRAAIDRLRTNKHPQAWTIWTSGSVIEGHHGGISRDKDELGGWHRDKDCAPNRLQLIWGLLMSFAGSADIRVAKTVGQLVPRLLAEYTWPQVSTSTTHKAQKSVKQLLYGQRLSQLQPKSALKGWDLLCSPSLAPSRLLKGVFDSREQHPCLVVSLHCQLARTVATSPLKVLRFFLPQILVSCRADTWGLLENQLVASALTNDAFHKELFTSITSEIATLEVLRTSRKGRAGADLLRSLILPFGGFGRLRERLAWLLGEKRTALQVISELDFFAELLDLSARSLTIHPITRRTAEIKRSIGMIAHKHGFPVVSSKREVADLPGCGPGYITPFGQPETLLAINISNCKALKSAARAPFVVDFVASENEHSGNPLVLVERSVIFKTYDDLRMDQVALQMITVSEAILRAAGLPLWLCPYGVHSCYRGTAFGGCIEMVRNTRSRHEIGKDLNQGLKTFFQTSLPSQISFAEAQWNFLRSLAAYSIVSFLIQIKDRHNANMLVTDEGYLVHIDFGFILDLSPAGDIRFERAPFKLTQEMIDLLNSNESISDSDSDKGFLLLRHLIVEGYMCVRKEKRLIVQMLRFFANSGLACFKAKTIRNLRTRLQWDQSDEHARQYITDQVDAAVNALSTRLYDAVQALQQGIAY